MEGLKQDIENIIYRRLAQIIGYTKTKVTDEAAADVYDYLVKKLKDIQKENDKLKEISSIQDSLINVIQKSNREYIYIALNCNAKHNK